MYADICMFERAQVCTYFYRDIIMHMHICIGPISLLCIYAYTLYHYYVRMQIAMHAYIH